jgi:hypothetical protein
MVIGVSSATAYIFILLWQYSDRLTKTLALTQAGNAALRESELSPERLPSAEPPGAGRPDRGRLMVCLGAKTPSWIGGFGLRPLTRSAACRLGGR